MIFLCKYSRVLTLFLVLFYGLAGSGLDKVAYRCASLIHRTVVFPCYGKGCQCDKAGYELSNCQCDHENKISCCSVKQSPTTEEETCCSDKNKECGITETCNQIENIPCQGQEDQSTHSLATHIVIKYPPVGEKLFGRKPVNSQLVSTLQSIDPYPIDKIPIFS